MQHVFTYIDYRDFLHDYYNERKREMPWFSLRVFGNKLGLNAAYLFRIMQKQEHLSLKKVPSIAAYFSFQPVEIEYFEALVGFARAKTDSEASIYFEKIMQLKGGVKSTCLDSLQYEYYKKWYYSAVLAVIGFFPVKNNYKQLSKAVFPQISTEEAKEAVELLEKLKLISRNEDGFFERTHLHISTGSQFKSLAVRKFQAEMIRLSEEAIERFPKEIRDISSLTLTMKNDTLDDIREILKQCRQAIISRVAEDEETDCAYQVNMQVFPVSDVQKRQEKT